MGKKAPDERPKKPFPSLNPKGSKGTVPADLGSDVNSNLGAGVDEDNDSHVIRTKKHPHHDEIERQGGAEKVVDSHLYKAYQDTIKNRIANAHKNPNINRPMTGPASVFHNYPGNELQQHFNSAAMDKNHQNPDYNKKVYYGTKKHTENSPGYFSGVYKTEEKIPKSEISAPKRKAIGEFEPKNMSTTGTKYTKFK